MINREFATGRFRDVDEQARDVEFWRNRYEILIAQLGTTGTQVLLRRTMERDQDIKPYSFVRRAVHEFIFPPQIITSRKDKSGIIDPTEAYSLKAEDISYGYDPDMVTGHIQISYDDADSRIAFTVTELMEGSVIPNAAEMAIAQAMESTINS